MKMLEVVSEPGVARERNDGNCREARGCRGQAEGRRWGAVIVLIFFEASASEGRLLPVAGPAILALADACDIGMPVSLLWPGVKLARWSTQS
ncbi:hypothetical protein ACWEP4_43200 [Streptomyces sp. NPDC004227]